MLLTSTTDKIEIVLGANVASRQLEFISSYNDNTSTSVTPSRTVSVTNNTTAVDLVPAPSSGVSRQLRWASIYNSDSVPATVTIRINYNGTTRTVLVTTLQIGEYIQYTHRTGWKVFDCNGSLKTTDYFSDNTNTWLAEYNITTGTISTISLGTTTWCIYLGRATGAYRYTCLGYRIITAAATVTWAELAVYKGRPSIGLGANLTRCGVYDASSLWTRSANTNYTTAVPVTGINAGDDIWAVIGNSAVTSAVISAASSEDNIAAGFLQSASSNRPSTNSTLTGTVRAGTAERVPFFAWWGI
jgi:hypothetical protein